MKAIQTNFYSDGSHGWLKVPRKLLIKLDLLGHISCYSYMRGDFVYLEEDSDCTIFFNCLESKFGANASNEFKRKVKTHYSERPSRIRNYSCFENIDLKTYEEYRQALLESQNWNRRGVLDIKNATMSYLRYWNQEYYKLGFDLK